MGNAATWSTRGLAGPRAHAAWAAKMSELHLPWSLSFPDDGFAAWIQYRKQDGVTLARFRGGRFAGSRASGGEAPGGVPLVGINLNLQGHVKCGYAGRDVLLGPRDVLIWDADLANGFEAVEPHQELTVIMPRERLPQGLLEAAARVRGPMSVARGTGLGAIAAQQLRAIGKELEHLDAAELSIALQGFLDTLHCSYLPVQEGTRSGARAALLTRIRGYIEQNLEDPMLGAPSIAESHGISIRTLHVVFAETGTTVGRHIRDRRLRRAYGELGRAGGSRTVTEVAFRCGFNDAAHFSRSFKQAFGVPPSAVLARSPGGARATPSVEGRAS